MSYQNSILDTEGLGTRGFFSAHTIILATTFLFPLLLFAAPITDNTGADLTFGAVNSKGDNITLTDSGNNGSDSNFVTFSGNLVTSGGLFTFNRQGNLTISGKLDVKTGGDVNITDPLGVTIVILSTTTITGDVKTEGGNFVFDRTGDLILGGKLETKFGANSGDISISGTGDATFGGDINVEEGDFTFNRNGDATFNKKIESKNGDISISGADLTFNKDIKTDKGVITITGAGTTIINANILLGNSGEFILDSGSLIVDPSSNVNLGIDMTFAGGTLSTSDINFTINTLTRMALTFEG